MFPRHIQIHYGQYERGQLFEAARRSRACAYLADDDHGPLALQEILLAGCLVVGVRTGASFVKTGETGIVVDRLCAAWSARSLASMAFRLSRTTWMLMLVSNRTQTVPLTFGITGWRSLRIDFGGRINRRSSACLGSPLSMIDGGTLKLGLKCRESLFQPTNVVARFAGDFVPDASNFVDGWIRCHSQHLRGVPGVLSGLVLVIPVYH